jgi:lipopolysaccharide export LptBFGC system permease protein LptF
LGALAISVGYALAYYLLSMRLGKQLAMSQGLPPEVAAWSTTSLGFAVGAVLLRKATRR